MYNLELLIDTILSMDPKKANVDSKAMYKIELLNIRGLQLQYHSLGPNIGIF